MMIRQLLYIAFLTLSVVACKQNYEEILTSSLVQKKYVPVRIQEITQTSERIPIYGMGRLSTDTETKLSFKIGGYISDLKFKEGDYVKKGRVMATVQTTEIDAQVLKAQRAVDKAERDLARIKKMYADSVATLENVEDLTTLVEVSKADLDIAKYNQSYAKIIAPMSGRVLRKISSKNELIAPGQPVYIIASAKSGTYVMSLFLSDKDIGLVKYGTEAKVTFDAFPGEEFSAQVSQIGESADPRTGAFEVELQLSPSKNRLRNGLIGKVELLPKQEDSFLKIPIGAVAEGSGDQIKVFVPIQADTLAKSLDLEVVRFTDDFVWAKEQDEEITKIITAGSAYLKDGQAIQIQK